MPQVQETRCTACIQWKPLDAFSRRNGRLRQPCRECCSIEKRAHYAANKDRYAERQRINRDSYRRAAFNPPAVKRCSDCREQLPWQSFNRNRSSKDGLCGICRSCTRLREQDYYARHPEVRKRASRLRRARIVGNGGSHTDQEWQEVLAAAGRACLACRRTEAEVKIERDHVVPLAKGGTDDIDNIQPLCRSCNANKRTETIDYRTGVC